MISQTTPAAFRPASRARSTAASVRRERSSTPPGRARSGNTCPGSAGRVELLDAADRDLDRVRAVVGRDPGRDALLRLDRDRGTRCRGRLVLLRHLLKGEFVAPLRGQAEADQAARFFRHEVDRLGGRELRGDRQVAFVLAVLRVHDDDEAALADVFDRVLDRCKRRTRLDGRHAGSVAP